MGDSRAAAPPRNAEASDNPSSVQRLAKLKLVAGLTVPGWGRAVLAILGSTALVNALIVGDVAGYAGMPGLYMALSPPAGSLRTRVRTVVEATVLLAFLAVLGAEASRSIATIVGGFAIAGFASSVLPRAVPRLGSLQLPLLIGFIYSAAHPLSEASPEARAAAVAVSLPVYVLAVAILFQTDPRRSLVGGAAALLGGVSDALARVAAGAPDAADASARALIQFRVVLGKLKDSALPLDESLEARAYRLLTVSVQQAVADTELLASDLHSVQTERDQRLGVLATGARNLAAALTAGAPVPSPGPLEGIASKAQDEGDPLLSAVATSLATNARALAVVRGASRELPPDLLGRLPSPWTLLHGSLTPDDPAFRRGVRLGVACALAALFAELAGLGRTYWAVFAVVVAMNAPAALTKRKALMRITGTVIGFLVAVPLVELVGTRSNLALVMGLLLLLPGVVLTPFNYAVAVTFITTAVAMLFSASGSEADFLRFRVADNAIGVAIVLGIGLVLWRTGFDDWWRSARNMARSLAAAFSSLQPARFRDELLTRAFQLRAETVEVAALPDATPAFNATWSFGAAASTLIRTVDRLVEDGASVAARLDAIAEACEPHPPRVATAAAEPVPRISRLVNQEVSRMAQAVALLHQRT
jgi:uncharacterized membrane protein YccC